MLNYSTREFRQLLRILSKRAVLWTEMVVDETVQHASNLDDHLAYDEEQHPIICQIGGNSPDLCGRATSVVLEQYGYDEVNLNIDCPSERVSTKREFGAILMKKAQLAADIVREMQSSADAAALQTPSTKVSVKCRIGVDDLDDLEFAADFIRTLRPVCRRFYLHARKCVLNGLMNARQNRSVPPLNYPRVYDLCRMFPDCEFWINGGIRTLEDAKLIAYGSNLNEDKHLHRHIVPCKLCNMPNGSCIEPPLPAPANLRGCMMGRAAMDDPCLFYDVDRYFYGEKTNPCKNRREVLERYCDYLERIYPPRCCEDDVQRSGNCCCTCIDVYGNAGSWKDEVATAELTNDTGDSKERNKMKSDKPKFSSKIIGRSLKPVQGIFHGVPSSRAFKRVCDKLGQNVAIRNCGPGCILRKAMQSVPSDILDQEF
ncbi:hypothetical protein ACHAXR_007842 [Thalassiosira sp. AJA248-18]